MAASLLSGPAARAQGGPVDIQMFKPAMDSKGHFSIDSTQVLSPWATSFGLLFNYAYRPLVLKGENGRFFRTNDLVYANLQFAMGLFKLSKQGKPWLEVGLGVPVVFHNSEISPDPFTRDQGDPVCPGGTSTVGCTVWQQGQENDYPMGYSGSGTASAQGLGDMYVHFKFRFWDTSTHPVGLGAMLSVYLPTSRVQNGFNQMLGSGGVTLAPKFLLDKVWRKYKLTLSVNFGLRLRFATDGLLRENPGWGTCDWTDLRSGTELPDGQACGQPGDDDYGFDTDKPDNGLSKRLSWLYEITYGAALSWRLSDAIVFVGELFGSLELSNLMEDEVTVEGNGTLVSGDFTQQYYKRTFPLELLAGFKFYLARSSFFAVGAGVGLTGVGPLDNVGSPDFRVFASFVFEPTVGDRDGDGIKDDVDKCPDKAEDFDDFEDKDGCPDPDNDGDGILDVDDRCPNTPENYNGFEDTDGCPEKKDEDRDGDGIPDSVDQCPDVPEDKDGYEDKDGCPDPDNDGDGVLDRDDRCPGTDADKASKFKKTKEDKDGFEDADGCPDPDNDQDGILDVDDQCPNEKETRNQYKDDDGCPDKRPIKLIGKKFFLAEKVYFVTNKDEIRKVSFKLLDSLASILKSMPELAKIEIQGHTDQRGSRRYNLELSQKRAESVKRYLVNKGIDPSRLVARGYGKGRLRCKAETPECWSKNRRVEFIIVKRK